MFPSYRNQSVDLQSKSNDCFVYDGNVGRERVKELYEKSVFLKTAAQAFEDGDFLNIFFMFQGF